MHGKWWLRNARTKVAMSHDILHEVLNAGIVKFNHHAECYPAPLKALSDYSETDLLIGTPVKPSSPILQR